MKFNRKIFYERFRAWRGEISPQQVKGLNFLLDSIERDTHVTRIDWAAYMLATVMHETAFTFMPIHEYGSHNYFVSRYGGQTAKGRELGNDTPEEGADYAGQGYVQLTGESNYEKSEVGLRREYPELIADFEKRTGKKFDLTVGDQQNDKSDTINAQDPMIAYAIMSYGMRNAMFTRYRLSDFLNDRKTDYYNARKIINGTDKANTIMSYAENFEDILRASLIRENEFEATSDKQVVLGEKQKDDTFPALPEETPSEVKDGASGSTSDTPATTETTQTADQITNIDQSQKNVPDNFVPEDKIIAAPPPSNMLSRAWRWLLGLGVIPTTGAGAVEAVKNLTSSEQFHMADVLEVVKQTFMFLLPYLFWVGLAFIVFWGIKELLKQISFMVNQYTLARADMHNVKVVGLKEPPPKGNWLTAKLFSPPKGEWQTVDLPKLPEAQSAVATTTGLGINIGG